MNPNLSVCCLFLLVHSVGANPLSSQQSLKKLFDGDLSTPPFSSEGREHFNLDQFSALHPFTSSSPILRNFVLPVKDNVLPRLKDFMRTSKRSWSRYKKGGLRSCFGVRLGRIGSFSGLGC
ncbi:natriuretic peptide A-like [Nematolebias whitei]|uniref:natriuretic peptide A-like n=1 Tax=Nematolebias whitei TaxID=451745 RepID=UPI00189B67B0|nr:natriuretic peptide A-like [Nematolebias whitei]